MEHYRLSLLRLEDCSTILAPADLLQLLKTWRKSHAFARVCSLCGRRLPPADRYTTCCRRFYYNDRITPYPVSPLALPTPGYAFLLPQLERMIRQAGLTANQEFLVLPDPIFWQVATTLVYEKVAKFVLGLPITSRTRHVQPPSKAPFFYRQIQEAPLNYGSLEARSCGKATMLRQVAFGKRCRYSMRGMIVPDASLRPHEIRIPDAIVERFGLRGQWVLLNRMPSLQPENFVGLRVPPGSWPHDCFGIPLEILESINGDFDGDEANVYLVPSALAQAECATLLNPEAEMKSFVMGLKLAPSQDMLVAYHLFYDAIDFLPIKFRGDLKRTLLTICEVHGSAAAFRALDALRRFYLDALQNRTCFALTFAEMRTLAETLQRGGDVTAVDCCLTTQIRAGAKGNFESLQQMFGSVGWQDGTFVRRSFLEGLEEGVEEKAHGRTALTALYLVSHIWLPGYGYQKAMSNGHAMVVSYAGSIVDGVGKRVVFKDALDAYHPEDILSAGTVKFFVEEVLVKGNLAYSGV